MPERGQLYVGRVVWCASSGARRLVQSAHALQHRSLVMWETVRPLDKGRFARELRGQSSSAISIVNKPLSLPPSSLVQRLVAEGAEGGRLERKVRRDQDGGIGQGEVFAERGEETEAGGKAARPAEGPRVSSSSQISFRARRG